MFRAIPGYCHLKTLDYQPTSHIETAQKLPLTPDITGIVQVALDATFGIRPLSQLPRARFDTRVRTHISAFLRTSAVRGRVRIVRLDAHPAFVLDDKQADELALRTIAAAEIVGSCEVLQSPTAKPTKKAFASRLEQVEGKRQWVMRSFRVF